MIKRVIIGVIFLGLGVAFFLQKQHEKKQALELAKRHQELSRAHATPSVAASPTQNLPQATLTPTLKSAPTAKPKPTPMLPKPTPMLRPSP